MTDIVEQERSKYQRVWEHDDYAQNSPGARAWPGAVEGWFQGYAVKTVLDAGAGSGKAAIAIRRSIPSAEITAMDLVFNGIVPAAEEVIDEKLEGCLWSREDYQGRTWDGVYCADVLEHIPEEFVPAVLRNLFEATRKVTYLGICLRADSFGPRLLGEPLHLTVQSARWWEDRIAEAGWSKTLYQQTTEDRLHVVLKP